jgi:hypothetical protein
VLATDRKGECHGEALFQAYRYRAGQRHPNSRIGAIADVYTGKRDYR